jgi:hypothetical protein
MYRPVKISKKNLGAQSSVNYGEGASEGVMHLTAAAAVLECRSALVEGREACRIALKNPQVIARIAPETAHALHIVGSYTYKYGRTSLHEAVIDGDAATVKALLVAGSKIDTRDYFGATPLYRATNETCREILEHHIAVLSIITEDPTLLTRVEVETQGNGNI